MSFLAKVSCQQTIPKRPNIIFIMADDHAFGLTRHYGIYTGRYKLMHFYNPIDAWELYDLKKDKLEMNNLYDDPGYSKVVQDLKVRLRKLQQFYKDDVVEKAVGSGGKAKGRGQNRNAAKPSTPLRISITNKPTN